jgi:hypothetical protein
MAQDNFYAYVSKFGTVVASSVNNQNEVNNPAFSRVEINEEVYNRIQEALRPVGTHRFTKLLDGLFVQDSYKRDGLLILTNIFKFFSNIMQTRPDQV